jgi:hypothetical protein
VLICESVAIKKSALQNWTVLLKTIPTDVPQIIIDTFAGQQQE